LKNESNKPPSKPEGFLRKALSRPKNKRATTHHPNQRGFSEESNQNPQTIQEPNPKQKANPKQGVPRRNRQPNPYKSKDMKHAQITTRICAGISPEKPQSNTYKSKNKPKKKRRARICVGISPEKPQSNPCKVKKQTKEKKTGQNLCGGQTKSEMEDSKTSFRRSRIKEISEEEYSPPT
jgi:hypothetical protein